MAEARAVERKTEPLRARVYDKKRATFNFDISGQKKTQTCPTVKT